MLAKSPSLIYPVEQATPFLALQPFALACDGGAVQVQLS